ncbi:MAG: ABC transporter ATP-binding protein [Thermoleophilia bacterium]
MEQSLPKLIPETGAQTASDAAGDKSRVIRTDGLTKRYGDLVAVDGLDLSIEKGEVFGLLGPNGAGKTTTILMLLGLTEPTSGRVLVGGHNPVREPLQVKSLVGYLPENVGFYGGMTGRRNLQYTARLNRIPETKAAERIDALLDLVGLTQAADRPAGTYSRGMRQRLGIADALVKNPQILILDEPTIGLDPKGINELLELIRRLSREEGITVLLSSHLLYQVQAVCDRVGIFVAGRLIACGPVEGLAAQLGGDGVALIEIQTDPPHADLAGKLAAIEGVEEITPEKDMWLVTATRDVRRELCRALVQEELWPVHLRLRRHELDDIYAHYFREGRETAHARTSQN